MVNGRAFRKAKNFKNKRDAQVWARELESEIDKGKQEESQDTLGQVFDRYAEERSDGKKGARWERVRLDRFKRDPVGDRTLGKIVISEITTADLVAWRDARLTQVKPASVKREMNLLKNVFKVAVKEWQLITSNPARDVTRPPEGKRRTRRVYDYEIEAISAAFDLNEEPWTKPHQVVGAAFLFAIETAMRSGEILAMKNQDIKGRYVLLPETKNDHPREVPFSPRAIEILKAVSGDRTHTDARPFYLNDNLRKAAEYRDTKFRSVVSSLEIEDLHFHDSRHEAITRLSKKLGIMDLARMTGHKNINELLTYYEASGDDLADKLN